ncbi:ABC transporter substrate-binding protein [Dactylosporangium fulvum]|uniref:ABC transporter substrate-binding protein n=1 Tax=Dactylosporangium fulvum TaxID=53359 RepID=A0ABY5WBM8_9ACTN|nr:ABC transporter substrate-binding protein [Dactylosporangium fulvum]UWP86745.1 ABC transporter substrate-binding protein [Dactylosporangium fulvum]
MSAYRRRWPTLFAGPALALAGLLASCSSAPSDSADAATPHAGGTLLIAAGADPGCLDPQQTGQLQALDISRSLVDSLTAQDPGTGQIVPWLAESFTVSADARKFSFVLRAGVTFSDGTPVNSQAVKATFDALSKLPPNGAAAYIQGYTGTAVVDDTHFDVGFAQPNAQFLQATSTAGFGILSIATAAKPLADRCRGQVVGSGPYVLRSYTPNQGVVLAQRSEYAWPSSLATNKGAAYLDEVRFNFVSEAGARTGALSSDQAQVAENVQPTDQGQFAGRGFHLLVKMAPGLVPPLSLNHRGVLADQNIRMALLRGVDRGALVSTVFNEHVRPATSVLASTTPYYVDQSAKLVYDPDGARQLLTASGWTPGPDGIRVKDGQQLTLRWLIPAPLPPANEYVQQQLRTIGVNVVLDVVPPAQYVSRQSAGDFDLTAVAVTRADPDALRNIFSTKGANLWHLPPSQLDTYLEEQATATTAEDRQTAVTNAVAWILDHADTVPLYETAIVHGVSDRVRDLRATASTQLDLHDAWLR